MPRFLFMDLMEGRIFSGAHSHPGGVPCSTSLAPPIFQTIRGSPQVPFFSLLSALAAAWCSVLAPESCHRQPSGVWNRYRKPLRSQRLQGGLEFSLKLCPLETLALVLIQSESYLAGSRGQVEPVGAGVPWAGSPLSSLSPSSWRAFLLAPGLRSSSHSYLGHLSDLKASSWLHSPGSGWAPLTGNAADHERT